MASSQSGCGFLKKSFMYGVETDMRSSPAQRDRYESIPKRDFKTALVRHLEDEYGILRSRRIILMLADDIEDMVGEYFPMKSRVKFGDIVWYTTADDGQRVSYGKKTEDYNVKKVILPLIIRNDIESRMAYKDKSRNGNYRKNKERDIKTMVRLITRALRSRADCFPGRR